MSFDKNFQNLNLKSVSKNSDSFDDRFCDDLCEDILQYLPLKDKLIFECVSKQFQRTLFKKQNEINLEVEINGVYYPHYSDSSSSYEQNLLRLEYPQEYQVFLRDTELEVISFESCYRKPIESLLKKCPNIQSIDLYRFYSNNIQTSKLMLRMITKYCNHLIEYKVYWFGSNDCIESQEFYQKFGPKLRYICYVSNVFDYNFFPNIESIDEYYRIVNQVQAEEVLQLKLDNLKNLKIGIGENKEHLLSKVMRKFFKLTHLTLTLETGEFNKIFKDLPSHQNIKELIIFSMFYQDLEGISDSLKEIAIKCPKLKKIALNSIIIFNKISDVKQLFILLKAFPSLKRLDISLKDESDFQTTDKWFSFELFKEMPKITHLSLHLYN